eukprot:240945-Pleurochrysis_carterae.AAC.1
MSPPCQCSVALAHIDVIACCCTHRGCATCATVVPFAVLMPGKIRLMSISSLMHWRDVHSSTRGSGWRFRR